MRGRDPQGQRTRDRPGGNVHGAPPGVTAETRFRRWSPVHEERLAGDVLRFLLHEEVHHVGHVLRLAEPPGRDAPELRFRWGLPIGLLFMKNSVLVGPGAMALTVIPNGVSSSDQTLGEVREHRLGARVCGALRDAQDELAGDVHDAPETLRLHGGYARPGALDGGDDVDFHDVVEHVQLDLFQGLLSGGAHVVQQSVELVLPRELLQAGADRAAVAEVHFVGVALKRIVRGGEIQVDNVVAGCGQPVGACASDASARAGDQRDSVRFGHRVHLRLRAWTPRLRGSVTGHRAYHAAPRR